MSSNPTDSTIAALLQSSAARLSESQTPRLDTEILLSHVLNQTRAWLYAHAEEGVPTAAVIAFDTLLCRRMEGEPVAHLTGTQEFWSLAMKVTSDVLIPRPETELLVEHGLQVLESGGNQTVLDLGTGSGAIAIALATERPDITIVACDSSPVALSIAQQNAQTHACNNITFCHSDWFKNLEQQKFNVIVSNPPYIPADDSHLNGDGVRFEPQQALCSGLDGLNAIRIITEQAPHWLVDAGVLAIEHGHDQAEAVQFIMMQHGFGNVQTLTDIEGRPRVTSGTIHQANRNA